MGFHYQKKPITPDGLDDDFAITRVATENILKEYSEKLVHCRKPKDVKQFQERIKNG